MVDVIYCISLERLESRRKNAIALLSDVDFCPVIFLDAVDASVYTLQDFHNENIYAYDGWKLPEHECSVTTKIGPTKMIYWMRSVTIGEIGCAVSHGLVWKHAHEMGYNSVLVLEDDFCFRKGVTWSEVMRYKEEYTKGLSYDILYVGCMPWIDNKRLNEQIIECEFAYLLHSYILTKEALRILNGADFFSNIISPDEFIPATYGNYPREDVRVLYPLERKLVAIRFNKAMIGQTNDGGSQTSDTEMETDPAEAIKLWSVLDEEDTQSG